MYHFYRASPAASPAEKKKVCTQVENITLHEISFFYCMKFLIGLRQLHVKLATHITQINYTLYGTKMAEKKTRYKTPLATSWAQLYFFLNQDNYLILKKMAAKKTRYKTPQGTSWALLFLLKSR